MTDILIAIVLVLSIVVFVAGAGVMVIFLASYVIGGSPYQATPLHVLDCMLAAAAILPGEKVYDLGCGDGRLLISANLDYQANTTGIELSPPLCWISRLKARRANARVTVVRANFFDIDFSDADVVFCYLFPGQMKRLADRFAGLRPGCRIVSLRFELPGWRPLTSISRDGHRPIPTIRVYRVAAPAAHAGGPPAAQER